MDNLRFWCKPDIYHFFEDYLNSNKIILVSNPNDANVFIQSLPKNVKVTSDTWILNTEQATRPNILEILSGCDKILDYSEENIHILKKIKPNAIYKHLSYKPNPSEILNIPKTKWLAMVGNNCDRRTFIEKRLWGVTNVTGWGMERDRELFKHKILINVHYDPNYRITEQLRINRCVYNNMIVITEKSDHQDLIELKDKILFCDYDLIVPFVTEVVLKYNKYLKQLGLN